jgi:hypothetical protein
MNATTGKVDARMTTMTIEAVRSGDAERCTECGTIQPGQSGQCRECGACSMETGTEVHEVDRATARVVTAAARAAFAAAKANGQDDGMAIDAAHEAVREMVGSRTGTFDSESLTWRYDQTSPEIMSAIRWTRTYVGEDVSEELTLVRADDGTLAIEVFRDNWKIGVFELDGVLHARGGPFWEEVDENDVPPGVIESIESGWTDGLTILERRGTEVRS